VSLRGHYTAELEQLRLQVEVMAVRVEQNLDRMRNALDDGATWPHLEAVRVDGEVDAMNVSLTERCYELIAREAPVASDLRLIVSVVRVLNELERISDHAVRICRDAGGPPLAAPGTRLHDLLVTIGDEVLARFHVALRAWGSNDLDLAEDLATGSPMADALHARLIGELLDIDGPDAVGSALRIAAVGRSLERISDHTAVVGARIRYLITGDPAHLAAEMR